MEMSHYFPTFSAFYTSHTGDQIFYTLETIMWCRYMIDRHYQHQQTFITRTVPNDCNSHLARIILKLSQTQKYMCNKFKK